MADERRRDEASKAFLPSEMGWKKCKADEYATDETSTSVVKEEASAKSAAEPILSDIGFQDSMENALTVAECALRLREREGESIQGVRNAISRFGPTSAEVVKKMGEKWCDDVDKDRVKALILFQLSLEMFQREHHKPDEAVEWLRKLAKDISIVAYELPAEESRSCTTIPIDYGVKVEEQILALLNGNGEMPRPARALARSETLYHIGRIYFRTGNYATALEYLKKAEECYNISFQSAAPSHESYCIALWTTGNCCYRLKCYADAEAYYVKTVNAVKQTTEIKEKWLKIAEADLEKAREKQRQSEHDN